MQSNPDKPKRLQSLESMAMLNEPLTEPMQLEREQQRASFNRPQLSIDISLQRSRHATVIVVVVVVMMLITIVMLVGTELKRFERGTMTANEQKQLLNRYNSYSGNVASAIGRPLEFVILLMAHVSVLWFMSDAVMSVENQWRVKGAVLVLSGALGFLLTNSLNALNVQIREAPVTKIMSSSDLIFDTGITNSSTMERSFSEFTPQNPTANTVMRNLILPRMAASLQCLQNEFTIDEDTITYGMPQRAWMKHFIAEALPQATTVRIDVLSNVTASKPTDFPMNASVAADLLILGAFTHSDYTPFTAVTPFNLAIDVDKWYPIPPSDEKLDVPTARLTGLLPPNRSATETQDRKWFLAHSADFLHAVVSPRFYQNASSIRTWTMELTRVNITPSVWVDAITLESVFDFATDGSRYVQLINFGYSPSHLVLPAVGSLSPRIDAFASCLNAHGSEVLQSTLFQGIPLNESNVVCANTSTTSMLVFSKTNRYVADTVMDNRIFNASGIFATDDRLLSVTKDLQFVSSTTFARISWRPQKLSEIYDARCEDNHGCLGLHTPLQGTDQRLLVSTSSLPLDRLSTIDYNTINFIPVQQPLQLVAIKRPTKVDRVLFKDSYLIDQENQGKDILAGQSFGRLEKSNITEYRNYSYLMGSSPTQLMLGDILLPHNIRHLNVDENATVREECARSVDRRVQNYVNNHLYMETTLQGTYTAAAYFIFQNGVAKDIAPASTEANPVLALDRDIHEMKVWLSIPLVNAVLTLVGCVLLVMVQLVALTRPHLTKGQRPWATQHHQIARVMVDDTTFPSLLLHRTVEWDTTFCDADKLTIVDLTVQRVEDPPGLEAGN